MYTHIARSHPPTNSPNNDTEGFTVLGVLSEVRAQNTHSRILVRARAHARTRAHTHTDTHRHTDTRTRTHTHTQRDSLSLPDI